MILRELRNVLLLRILLILFKNRKVVEYMDIGVLLFICSVVVGLLVVIYMWYTF